MVVAKKIMPRSRLSNHPKSSNTWLKPPWITWLKLFPDVSGT